MDYRYFISFLDVPKIIYLSLPSGNTVDKIVYELIPFMKEGNLILDGGNSFYIDSMSRKKRLWEKGIYFLDCSTGGGV